MAKGTFAGRGLERGSRLRRVEGIAWREIEGEAVLVNVRSDEVIHLNPTASFLWSSLDGRASLEEIASSMTGEFDVEMDTALADTVAFAADLVEQGAAEVVELE
ncbi:MAG: PqqD family protein [Actinomycetota bacterium]